LLAPFFSFPLFTFPSLLQKPSEYSAEVRVHLGEMARARKFTASGTLYALSFQKKSKGEKDKERERDKSLKKSGNRSGEEEKV